MGTERYDPVRATEDVQPILTVVNIILQQHAAKSGIRVGNGRYFFPAMIPPSPLGARLDAWKGFFVSVRPAYNQLMVNINVCMSAFHHEGNLAERIDEFMRTSSRSEHHSQGIRNCETPRLRSLV